MVRKITISAVGYRNLACRDENHMMGFIESRYWKELTAAVMNNMLKEWKARNQAVYLSRPFSPSLHSLSDSSDAAAKLHFTSFPSLAYSAGLDWIERADQFAAAWARSGRPGPAVPIAAHANYLIGHELKVQAFIDHGMWRVDDEAVEAYKRGFEAWHTAAQAQETRQGRQRGSEGPRTGYGDKRHWTDFCTGSFG